MKSENTEDLTEELRRDQLKQKGLLQEDEESKVERKLSMFSNDDDVQR